MYETDDELRSLQDLLDESARNAGPHLRSIFTSDRALTAAALAARLQGRRQAAVATISAREEPRVAPVDMLFLHGRFWFGTHASAARIRHLRARPAVSLTSFDSDTFAVIAHGRAALVEFGDDEFAHVDVEFVAVYGGTPSTPDERSVYVRVEPTALYTLAVEQPTD
jgi:hypothetical protein